MAPRTPADKLGHASTLQLPTYDNDDQSSTNSTTPLHKDEPTSHSEETTDSTATPTTHGVEPFHPPKLINKSTTSPSLKLTSMLSKTSTKQNPNFPISLQSLNDLHDPKSLKQLYNLGGIENLLTMLHTSTDGLNEHNESDLNQRKQYFGVNKLPQKVQKSFLKLCWEALKDKVLVILCIAAIISLALGCYESFGSGTHYDDEGLPLPKVDYVEGLAILVAVAIVVLVGAANDYQKERQFAKLNAKKEDREVIVVRNGGEQKLISIYDLMVGDVINLQTGDVVPADCILIQGEVECDESALTGESHTIHKVPVNKAMKVYQNHLPTDEDIGSTKIKFRDPYLISGAKVLSGLGNAVITAVGTNSIHGRTMMSLNHEPESTPMQVRLNDLAEGISKYGFLAAIVLFVVLFIRFCVEIAPPNGNMNDAEPADKGKRFIDIIITAVTIVVVAIPEGLPLAVTLALAFATTRMAQNGNLVRVLKSCETMGGATAVCSDKTGTLTENKMRIVRGFFGLSKQGSPLEFNDTVSNQHDHPTSIDIINQISSEQKIYLTTNIILNSTAFENSEYDEEKAKLARQKPLQQNFFSSIFQKNKKSQYQQMGLVDEPYLGNKTESALLTLAKDKFHLFDNKSLETYRQENHDDVVQIIPFESSRKWAGIVMKIPNGYRLYVKGAAEIIFKNCGFENNINDELIKLDRNKRDDVLTKIDEYANDALRAIALGHRDFVGISSWPPSELINEKTSKEADPTKLINTNFTITNSAAAAGASAGGGGSGGNEIHKMFILDALVGIQDPLKQGVTEAVLQCKRAGVTVRMVTGDNINTAKSISKECNILTLDDLSNDYSCMEGPQFRKLSIQKRREIIPQLKVLARSSPEDKRILVDTLRKSGEVVAVTGDGTNDAPALKLADVGFSMGIAGTEVAREASDIILMTDDFTDIVQAIKWGRTVSTSIKKFIQFQLTVNITACVLTFVSAVASSENKSVLTAVQLLWVNLIMDTLAALALATDKPDDSFLNRKPAGRTAPLISTSMWKMIIGQSMTQLIITFILHFAGKQLFFPNQSHINNHSEKQLAAMTFNTFVWLQFWKLFVTRKLDEADEINTIKGRINRENLDFFQHLFRNWYFLSIAFIIGGFQILIMFVGGAAFSIARQTPGMWATAILCGFISIPVGLLIRIIPNVWIETIFPTKTFKKFLYIVGFGWLKRNKKNKDNEDEIDLEGGDGDSSGGNNNNSDLKESKE